MSYYKKLKADLTGAASAGIITPQQADQVWERSYSERAFASLKAVHIIGAVAGLFIALGVILVAAHNWDKIGAIAKMGAYLLLFAGVAEAAMRLEEKPSAAVPLETLWFFMPVLGIGLYAQIFNLSGDPVKPYLAWAALSAPLAALSKRPLAGYLTSILLFTVLYWGTLGSTSILSLTARYNQPAQPLWHWALALGVLAAGVALYPVKKFGKPLGAGIVWVFFMLVADTAIKVRSEALVLLAGMSLAVLWLSWDGGEDEKTLPGLPLTVWTGAVYMTTFFWHYKDRSYYSETLTTTAAGTLLTWAAFAGAVLTLVMRKQRLLPEGKTEDALARALLAASMLCAFLLFDANEGSAKILAVIANLILAAFGAGCIISGSKNSNEKLINRGVAVITLTAVTRFVDIFGGLLKSGVAFILTGLAFAALAYGINRGRKALIEAAKK
ncbi:MAG: hypothetical protein A3I76_08690 [Elusimicrobia bacterium RIFCSPLOWO2_02_FULL_61_11]|nr:MAG: hypothetical protein A3I76_08690 [Elusimicrobia bacterium RIFCSPLOWO2_02_FULL_61_11]